MIYTGKYHYYHLRISKQAKKFVFLLNKNVPGFLKGTMI